jgi:uncharacterized protein YjiS (DUF1127 family)
MNTRSFQPTLPLHRPAAVVLFEVLRERWSAWQARRREAAQLRLAAAVERELMQLDSRTLQDIGAPQGLVGTRRWRDEQASAEASRLLDRAGW